MELIEHYLLDQQERVIIRNQDRIDGLWSIFNRLICWHYLK